MATLQNGQPKERFIEGHKRTGTIAGGARAAGVARSTVYNWLKDDSEFAARAKEAKEEVIDAIEEEAFNRARNKSDLLTIFVLKHNRPEVCGDNQKDNEPRQIYYPSPLRTGKAPCQS